MKRMFVATLTSSVLTVVLTLNVLPIAEAAIASDINLATTATINTSVTGITDSMFTGYETTYPGNLIGSSDWHGFCRQGGRDVIITLPQTSTIDTVSIQFEQNITAGVHYPVGVDFSINQNDAWYAIGTVRSALPATDIRQTVQTYQVHLNHLASQTFRIHIPVGVWVFARSLRIMGTPGTSDAETSHLPLVTASDSFSQYHSPMSPLDARSTNIHNMLLVYTGGYGTQGVWSSNDFLPMVAYQPQTGSVQTRMFDTMLFLPYGTVSGSQADWSSYLQDLFMQNQQLYALDAAVAQQNQALQTPNFRENVVLTIPYAPYGLNDWGSVGGQTINFAGSVTDPNGLQARNAALHWYLQTILTDWQQANLSHLHLAGFYWEHESLNTTAPGEAELLQSTVGLVHQQGLPLFWIPFYGADGDAFWPANGFDAAWLQPNYIEQGSGADVMRIKNAELQAASLGTGVELELNGFDAMNMSLYLQSLQQFAADGFGQSVSHAFYDGSKMFLYAANATDTATRSLYDATFRFINHS